ncbi:MAG: helix-turn-helix transcriptional regulator [Bacteroidetes bacterium]|nr:helix-turn-helix transcriptional regulator [Bacteroidota bacterium]
MKILTGLHELLPSLDIYGFAVQHHPVYINTTRNPHALDVILFSWFIAGSGTHFIADNQFAVQPGSVGITPIGIPHNIISTDKMDIINLFINPKIFPLPALPEKFLKYLQILLPLQQGFAALRENGIQINCTHPGIITTLLKQLLWEQSSERYGRIEICYELLQLIFMQMIREIVENGHISISRMQNHQSEKIMQVVSYLDTHYLEPYTLDALTGKFSISRAALCANFKKTTGKTIFAYILMKRIERSSLLLTTTTESITEIAHSSGFNDISFFNRKFKELTGASPRELRKES